MDEIPYLVLQAIAKLLIKIIKKIKKRMRRIEKKRKNVKKIPRGTHVLL